MRDLHGLAREIVNLQFVQAMVSSNKNSNMKQENA